MKKYIKPSVEVFDMELTNGIMVGSQLSQQGDFTDGQRVLESRRRDARSEE